MSKETNFDKIYNKVVEELRGNLTNEEYREPVSYTHLRAHETG
jgi:hypothetical protein